MCFGTLTSRTIRKPPCFGWLPLRSIVGAGSDVGDGVGDGVGLGVGDGEGVGERVGDGEGEALGVGLVVLPPPQAITRNSMTKVAAKRGDRIAINGNDSGGLTVLRCQSGYSNDRTAAYNQAVFRRCSHV
jgi:hypothetical protein